MHFSLFSHQCPPPRASFCHANVKGLVKSQILSCLELDYCLHLLSVQNPEGYTSSACLYKNVKTQHIQHFTHTTFHTHKWFCQVLHVWQMCMGMNRSVNKWDRRRCGQWLWFPFQSVNHPRHTLPAVRPLREDFSKAPWAPLHIKDSFEFYRAKVFPRLLWSKSFSVFCVLRGVVLWEGFEGSFYEGKSHGF